jgi:HK97 family phage major capsid protein
MPDLLTMLRQRHDADLARASAMLDTAEAAGTGLTPDQRTQHDELLTSVTTLAERIADVSEQNTRAERHHRAQELHGGSPAVVTSEPRTYTEHTAARDGLSLVTDLYRSTFSGDYAAADRLQRHRREMAGIETRDVGTSAFGGLVPPQYLLDAFAPIARAGRPTANSLRGAQLPVSGMSLVIPRGTTGTTEAIQNPQNTPVSLTDYVETDLTIPVATIAGQQNLSRQALERGVGIDQIIFADLAADYALRLNQQVLLGSGAAGQMLGITLTPGVNAVAFTTGAPTVALLWPKLANAVSQVNTGRFLPPTVIVMHPRRWAWITAAVDSTGRPLFNFSNQVNAAGLSPLAVGVAAEYGQVVGMMMGLPVVTDASIPVTYVGGVPGAGTEDVILVLRGGSAGDLILWEDGDGVPKQLKFEETIAGSLTIKLVVYGYAAFSAGRYPLGTSIISGTGLVAPTF